jgi:trk system potassium uptake protein TrkA
MDRVNAIKDKVALAVRMDASHPDALKMHGIGDVDVLIAGIANNFEAQVLLVAHAKQHNIPKIIARATSPDHIRVLKAVGAHEAFNPEMESARMTVQRLLVRNITNYFELAEGFSVVEISAPEGVIGKSIQNLDLRRKFRINLIAIKTVEIAENGAQILKSFDPVPDPAHRIAKGEILALVGSVLDIANFIGHYE